MTGSPARFGAFTATTDARQVEGALCYGPLAGNLHGADEWVDIASLEQTARVVALAAVARAGRDRAARMREEMSQSQLKDVLEKQKLAIQRLEHELKDDFQ